MLTQTDAAGGSAKLRAYDVTWGVADASERARIAALAPEALRAELGARGIALPPELPREALLAERLRAAAAIAIERDPNQPGGIKELSRAEVLQIARGAATAAAVATGGATKRNLKVAPRSAHSFLGPRDLHSLDFGAGASERQSALTVRQGCVLVSLRDQRAVVTGDRALIFVGEGDDEKLSFLLEAPAASAWAAQQLDGVKSPAQAQGQAQAQVHAPPSFAVTAGAGVAIAMAGGGGGGGGGGGTNAAASAAAAAVAAGAADAGLSASALSTLTAAPEGASAGFGYEKSFEQLVFYALFKNVIESSEAELKQLDAATKKACGILAASDENFVLLKNVESAVDEFVSSLEALTKTVEEVMDDVSGEGVGRWRGRGRRARGAREQRWPRRTQASERERRCPPAHASPPFRARARGLATPCPCTRSP